MATDDYIADRAIERWTHAGLDCAMAPGMICLNGYVRLPEGTLRLFAEMHHLAEHEAWRVHHAEASAEGQPSIAPPEGIKLGHGAFDDRVEVHGGLTYGVDEHGWLGFDTGHAGDCWAPDDLAGVILDEHFPVAMRVQATMGEIAALFPCGHRWTRELLRAEVNRLAEQVAALAKEADVRDDA